MRLPYRESPESRSDDSSHFHTLPSQQQQIQNRSPYRRGIISLLHEAYRCRVGRYRYVGVDGEIDKAELVLIRNLLHILHRLLPKLKNISITDPERTVEKIGKAIEKCKNSLPDVYITLKHVLKGIYKLPLLVQALLFLAYVDHVDDIDMIVQFLMELRMSSTDIEDYFNRLVKKIEEVEHVQHIDTAENAHEHEEKRERDRAPHTVSVTEIGSVEKSENSVTVSTHVEFSENDETGRDDRSEEGGNENANNEDSNSSQSSSVRVEAPHVSHSAEHDHHEDAPKTCRFGFLIVKVKNIDHAREVVRRLLNSYVRSSNCSMAVREAVEKDILPIEYLFSDDEYDYALIRVEMYTFSRDFTSIEKSYAKKLEKAKREKKSLDSVENFSVDIHGLCIDQGDGDRKAYHVTSRFLTVLREVDRELYTTVIETMRRMVMLNPPPLPADLVPLFFKECVGVDARYVPISSESRSTITLVEFM